MKPPFPPSDEGAQSSTPSSDPPADGARTASVSISGPISIVQKNAPPELRAWAKTMLDAAFGQREPEQRDRDETPAPEDSNISIGDPHQKRVRLDDLLTAALADVGYKRIAKLAYRADWSTTDVEHILSFETQGTPKIFMFASAGLRNAEAEAFADQCQRQYTMPVIRNSKFPFPSWFCSMHFSMNRLAGSKTGAPVNTLELTQAELTRFVQGWVTTHLRPYVGSVTTLESFREFLERDEEPMRWFRVPGFFRAAIVAFLARKLGFAPHRIEASLRPFAREILHGVDTTRTDPDGYVANIIRDADGAIAASPKTRTQT